MIRNIFHDDHDGVHMKTNDESSLLFKTLLYAIYMIVYMCIFVLGSAPLYLKLFSPLGK